MDQTKTTPEQPARYMRVNEAADYLRIKRTTFDKFCREYNIPACTHGGNVRIYDRVDLDAAAEKSKQRRHAAAQEPDLSRTARAILSR